MLSVTFALLSLASGALHLMTAGPATPERPGPETASVQEGGAPPGATFTAEAKAVSNWREEAVQDLHPTPLSRLAVALRAERPVVTRCVKLNNYWCIKSARWNGEIGTDDEGHVGFASADQGADAAVRLLRRYYLDFNRKSALDIVRRWAPAECRVSPAGPSAGSGPPAVLAVRGIGNTLRARWLAGRRPKPVRTKVAAAGGAVPIPQKPAASRVSAVPLPPLPPVRMPTIMAGIGAAPPVVSAMRPLRGPPRRQPTPASVAAATAAAVAKTARPPKAAAPASAARTGPPRAKVANPVAAPTGMSPVPVNVAFAPPPRPAAVATAAPAQLAPAPQPASRPTLACSPDEQRIQNYAGRMVLGLGLQPGDDLNLFQPDGRPLPNLARVLLAMSSFELGYLRASVELVDAAIARATPRPIPPENPESAVPAAPVIPEPVPAGPV